ncbi:sugar phosphate isomerase/epimerase family protein [Novosphingobium profundi]|uniref:sugar phosphate isomerase/epimerase family protein n=1 Tax=Novosphingobium profundi TaxID=1774954 RepID=UPI001CFCB139|nr:sugar phosphate isomerase/epimerase family protein [Novosphingobium profundi]
MFPAACARPLPAPWPADADCSRRRPLPRRELLQGALVAATLALLPPARAFAATPPQVSSGNRLAITTVSLRARYPFGARAKETRSQDRTSLLDAPDFVARDLGLPHIELWSLQFPDTSADYLDTLRARSEAAGCPVCNIQVDNPHNLASPDAQERAAAIRAARTWLDIAQRLGAPSIRVNLGAPRAQAPFAMDAACDSFRELADEAGARGMLVLTENHLGPSRDAELVADFLDRLDHPRCRVIVDWGNSAPTGTDDVLATTRLLAPWLHLVSAKGMAFDRTYTETSYDIARIVQASEKLGFRGLYSIELFGETPAWFCADEAAKAMARTIGSALENFDAAN